MNTLLFKSGYRITVTLISFTLLSGFSYSQSWNQVGMDLDGESLVNYFGTDVSMNSTGNVVAVGGPLNDGGGTDAGHVRVYNWNGSVWNQLGSDINGAAADDQSGTAIGLDASGSNLVIGSPFNDGNGSDAGMVRLYYWNSGSWIQKGTDIFGGAAGDELGSAVCISGDGNVIAVGAIKSDTNGTSSGEVQVYEWNWSSWIQRGAFIVGDAAGDEFGNALSLNYDGTVLAIGSKLSDGGGSENGTVKVYEWGGTSWSQRGTNLLGEGVGDQFGSDLALNRSGDVLIVGAPLNDDFATNAGHARVFNWNGIAWAQRGSDIDGFAALDRFGYAVSIDSLGSTVAIGAKYSDAGSTDAGTTYMYEWNGSLWIAKGSAVHGESDNDASASSVAINSSGEYVIIGATGNDGGGIQAGHARVFSYNLVGLSSSNETYEIKTYPNPSTGLINISVSDNCSLIQYVLYNSNGKTVHAKALNKQNTATVHLDVQPGVYYLTLESDCGWSSPRPIVIQ